MKLLIIITILLLSILCRGQDASIIYKERNLLAPKEYIQTCIYKDIISKYNNIEMICESYNFLFKGFEKYGYSLQIDTTYSLNESLILAQIIGYFDLINNSDSTIKACFIGWSIDNMGLGFEGNRDSFFKAGDSMKIKYSILKGLGRIENTDWNASLMPTLNENDIITSKKKFIDNIDFIEKFKISKAYFRLYNRLNICGSKVDVVFMIPVSYIREIIYKEHAK